MDSSDVQQALPANGHDQLCDVETTGSNPIEPGDRPEREEPFRSAQPVLDAAAPEKHKPSTSPTKHLTAKGPSGPPTPQVKRVLSYLGRSLTLFLTRTPHIADFKLG
jgi:hypothetical protein